MVNKINFSLNLTIVLVTIWYYMHVIITIFVWKQQKDIVEAENNYNSKWNQSLFSLNVWFICDIYIFNRDSTEKLWVQIWIFY